MLDRYIGDAESLTAEPSGLTKGVDGEMRRSPPYISRGILVVLIVAVTVGQARTLGEIAETNLRYSATDTAVKVMNTSKVELGERQKVLRRLADPRSLSPRLPAAAHPVAELRVQPGYELADPRSLSPRLPAAAHPATAEVGAQGERQKDFHELDDARSPSPELPSAGATIEARTLRLYHLHTRESLTVTYKKDGRYIPEALAQLDYFLRDWRANGLASMSAETIDLMWELHEELGSKQPINIICGFRSEETNALLKRIGRHVASQSQHVLGRAIDMQFPDVPLEKLRNSALVRQAGGVGYYPSSGGGFIHIDSGRVRHWPWISETDLGKIFAVAAGSGRERTKESSSAFRLAGKAIQSLPSRLVDLPSNSDWRATALLATKMSNNSYLPTSRGLLVGPLLKSGVAVPIPRSKPTLNHP